MTWFCNVLSPIQVSLALIATDLSDYGVLVDIIFTGNRAGTSIACPYALKFRYSIYSLLSRRCLLYRIQSRCLMVPEFTGLKSQIL